MLNKQSISGDLTKIIKTVQTSYIAYIQWWVNHIVQKVNGLVIDRYVCFIILFCYQLHQAEDGTGDRSQCSTTQWYNARVRWDEGWKDRPQSAILRRPFVCCKAGLVLLDMNGHHLSLSEQNGRQYVDVLFMCIFNDSFEFGTKFQEFLYGLLGDNSAFVQVMAWCHQATGHYWTYVAQDPWCRMGQNILASEILCPVSPFNINMSS